MRFPIVIFIVLAAFPVSADDGFTLGLTEMDFAAESPEQKSDGVVSMVTDQVPPERAEILAFSGGAQAAHRQRTDPGSVELGHGPGPLRPGGPTRHARS